MLVFNEMGLKQNALLGRLGRTILSRGGGGLPQGPCTARPSIMVSQGCGQAWDEEADWGKGCTEDGYLGELASRLAMRFPTGVI